jgi:hypothetical protein
VVAITVTADTMRASRSGHHARWYPNGVERPGLWRVSWLAERVFTRDQALAALALAELVTAMATRQHSDRYTARRGPVLTAWADQIGLSVDEALARLTAGHPARARE